MFDVGSVGSTTHCPPFWQGHGGAVPPVCVCVCVCVGRWVGGCLLLIHSRVMVQIVAIMQQGLVYSPLYTCH